MEDDNDYDSGLLSFKRVNRDPKVVIMCKHLQSEIKETHGSGRRNL